MTSEPPIAVTRLRGCALSAIVLAIFCVLPTSAYAQTTALFLDSPGGYDWVGGTGQHTYLTGNGATFTATSYSDGTIFVDINGPTFWWNLYFRPVVNSGPLQVGQYYGATEYPGHNNLALDVAGNSHGCNQVNGRFWVRQIVMAGTVVQKLAIDFEQHCDMSDSGLFGALRYNSDIGSLVPFDGAYPTYRLEITPTVNGTVSGTDLNCQGAGPVCAAQYAQLQPALTLTATPDPGFYFSGWSGNCQGGLYTTVRLNTVQQCGALFTPVNAVRPSVLMLNSFPNDWVARGKRQILNDSNAVWSRVSNYFGLPGVRISAEALGGGTDVTSISIGIPAPNGVLTPGTYPAAAVDVGSDSHACSQTSGALTVYEAQIVGNSIDKLAVDFVQNCEGVTTPPKPMVGSLRINSSVPPHPSIALQVSSGGSIQISPSGQICTTNCVPTFNPGTPVTMTAVPQPGNVFLGWQGDAECLDGTLVIVAPVACQAQFTNQTTADSVSPSSAVGASQTFTLSYSTAGGGNALSTAWVWFSPTFSQSSANSCLLYYQPNPARFFLVSDDGTTWQSGLAGSSSVLQNSQCAIDLLTSGATVTGNTLRMSVRVTFKPAAAGSKKIFMYGTNNVGGNTGWQEKGLWIVPNANVNAVSTSPNTGAGTRQTFTLTFSDTNGGVNLSQGWVWFTSTFSGSSANSCIAYYELSTNRFALLNDAGTIWSFATLGSDAPLRNSQCIVSPSMSTVSVSGTNLIVNLAMTFLPAYAGAKQIWMYGTDGVQSSSWRNLGTWTAQAAVITSGAASPASGTGGTQTFSLPFTDNLGATEISKTWVWFSPTLAGSAAGSCLVYYERATNSLFLLNDAGTQWLQVALGQAVMLENSQCAIAVAGSSVTLSGDTLTLQLSMTFKPVFAGVKNIYLFTEGVGGTSGWIDRGDWIVPSPPSPVTADAVGPSTGNGSSQTFALTYSSTSGAGSLSSSWVWFNATLAQSAAASCLAYYEPGSGQVSLLNDAGTAWQSAALGATTTLQNSQCALHLAGSQAVLSGNTLTLTLDVTFKSAFAGAKNIYLYAAMNGVSSGWQDRGDWTVPSAIAAVGVTPAAGNAAATMFALTYASENGASDLQTTWVWFNATLAQTAAASCLVYYEQPSNTLFLLNDAATLWQSATIGAGGVLQNSQCTIDMGGVSLVPGGNTLTLNLPVTFSHSFNGAKNIYMYAASAQSSSGWQDVGDWTVP